MATGRAKTFRLLARAAIAIASVALAAPVFVGCGARCAASSPAVRDGRDARCERTCPARSELARGSGGTCACASGLDLLEGACVTPAEAAAFCGATASWSGHACVAHVCAGSAPDATTGACVPALRLRALALAARNAHDEPDDREGRSETREDRAVRCHDGHTLAARDDQITCLPDLALCPRGSLVIGGSCALPPPCAVGEVASAGRCVPLVTRGGAGDPFAVDVGAWATALLGPDGGDGTPLACGPLAATPASFGPTHAVRLAIDLGFPDNDVTRLVVRVSATDADTRRPVPPAAARLALHSIESLARLLRALGGASTTASLPRTLLCPLPPQSPPALFPAGPDHAPIDPHPPNDAFD